MAMNVITARKLASTEIVTRSPQCIGDLSELRVNKSRMLTYAIALDEAAMFNQTFRPTATSEQDVSDFLERPHVDKVSLPRRRVHVETHLDHQDLIYG